MKETPTWLIIDLKTKRPLYGAKNKTCVFSTEAVAYEIASQIFEKSSDFIIVQIPDFSRL